MANDSLSPQDLQDLIQLHQLLPASAEKDFVHSTLQQSGYAGAAPSVPVPSGLQEPSDPRARFGEWAMQQGIGAAKGGLNTLYKTGELASKYLAPEQHAQIQARQQANPAQAANVQDLLTPDAGQKLGYYGEQMGEFMLPDALVGKAAKGAELLAGGSKLAQWGARAGTRVLGGAATSGVVNTMHGGGFDQGALFGGLGAGIGETIAGLGNGMGSYLMNNALNIPGRKLAQTNVGQYLMNNPILAMTKQGLRDAAGPMAHQVGEDIDALAANSAARLDLSPTADIAQQKIGEFAKQNSQDLIAQGQKLKGIVTHSSVLDPVTGIYNEVPRPNPASLADAVAAKRGLGNAVQWNGNQTFQKPAIGLGKRMYANMLDTINTAEPEMRPLNNAYENLNAIRNSQDAKASLWQHLQTLGSAGTMGAVGAATGAYQDHSWAGAATGALAGEALYLGARSVPGAYAMGVGSQLAPFGLSLTKNAFLVNNTSDNHGTNY